MLDHLSITERCKMSHPQINSNVLVTYRQLRSIRHLARKRYIPLVHLPLNRDRLDFALDGTMQLDACLPDFGEVKGLPIELPARSVRVGKGVVAVAPLEPRITGRF